MSPEDWAVVADRLLVEGHPRAEALALGLRRGPDDLHRLAVAADLAPVLPADAWPWVLLCPPLTRAMTLELYAQVRPKLERESRRVLPTAGSLAQLSRALRKKPRRPLRMRRLQRPDRHDRVQTLARLLDPMMPERWRWAALAHLIAGDVGVTRHIVATLRRSADIEPVLQLIQPDTAQT